MKIVLYVFVFGFVIALTRVIYRYSENQVGDRLREDRLEPVTVKLNMWKGTRYRHHIDFVAHSAKGQRVTGHAIKSGGKIDIFYDGDFDRLAHLRDSLSSTVPGESQISIDPSQDLETRIQFETNQRLERIQGDRESFLANDLNADGVIDAQEWDIVRERIAAEVRAELSGEAASEEPGTQAEVVDEPEEVEADGHW